MPELKPYTNESLLVPIQEGLFLRLVLPEELCLSLLDYVDTSFGWESEESFNFLTTEFEELHSRMFVRVLEVVLPEIADICGLRPENLVLLPPVVRKYNSDTNPVLMQSKLDDFADCGLHIFLQRAEDGGNIYFPRLRFSSKIVPVGWGVLHSTEQEYGISKVKKGETYLLSFWFKEKEESPPE